MRRDASPGARGFTLVELIVTLVVFSVMAATLVVFYQPVVASFVASRNRAALVEAADHPLRRMQRDVQAAVPNSVRTPDSQCFEVVPTSMGGRARVGDDTVNAGAAVLDTTGLTTSFDVLSPLPATPAAGDWVAMDNQNPNDIYSGANRSTISAVSTPSAALGRHRLTVASKQFPLGYDGGRFVVVPDNQKAVFYVCSGADGTLDANGHGKGTLYRLSNYGFNATPPAACPSTSGAPVMATQLQSCLFQYDPNQGATQQNGFVSMKLQITRDNESATLVVGAHVSNTP